MKPRHVQILKDVLSIPTAAFREQGVIDYVRRWADATGVRFEQDAAGNVVLSLSRGPRPKGPQWVFAAHMDHPAFVVVAQDGREVLAEFRGSVAQRYFAGSPVRLFAASGSVSAVVASGDGADGRDWPVYRLRLADLASVGEGTIGMWDFPGVRIRGSRLSSRGCDDLVGTASVLCAFEEIMAAETPARVMGLLTRAEEVGAVGAALACRNDVIPAGAAVVGIETSQAQPGARLGDGVVIRVGDSKRTFDVHVTGHLSAVAGRLARQRASFRHVRQLMPGGWCESSVYCAWGHSAGAVCLPLGNYHNQGGNGRIAPERIDLGDFASTVALLSALPVGAGPLRNVDAEIRDRINGLVGKRAQYL